MEISTKLNPSKVAHDILGNFPIISEKISIATGLSESKSKLLFEEVIKYLAAVNECSVPLSPSYLVDQAWHQFLLHTLAYRNFCIDYLGKFIHHIPGRKYATEDEYNSTISDIERLFGPINSEFWPPYSRGAGQECDGNPSCLGR